MNVGLVAHDSKKKLMQNFCIAYRGILNKHELYATGTTGRLILSAKSRQSWTSSAPRRNPLRPTRKTLKLSRRH